jgi:adenosylcobyric acid synthase
VFPFAADIALDAEDSVSLDVSLNNAHTAPPKGNELNICIVRLPHMSNFTDFRLLPHAEYVTQPAVRPPDCIILPGSKNTIEDLLWLRRQGLDRWILEQHASGAAVWGICGGYQMLGKTIRDPHGMESRVSKVQGLGLLSVETMLLSEKTTRAVTARTSSGAATFGAYEIHMGETTPPAGDSPFAWIEGRCEGFRQDASC